MIGIQRDVGTIGSQHESVCSNPPHTRRYETADSHLRSLLILIPLPGVIILSSGSLLLGEGRLWALLEWRAQHTLWTLTPASIGGHQRRGCKHGGGRRRHHRFAFSGLRTGPLSSRIWLATDVWPPAGNLSSPKRPPRSTHGNSKQCWRDERDDGLIRWQNCAAGRGLQHTCNLLKQTQTQQSNLDSFEASWK